jgi:toxin-antitoxin system PIN domain toxin
MISGNLLDSSVLIALSLSSHPSHDLASDWFARTTGEIITCPITEGALIRILLSQRYASYDIAMQMLERLHDHPRHRFIADDITFLRVPPNGIVGHRQVTDAYLAHLARHHGLRLATLDRAQAALNPDITDLIQ